MSETITEWQRRQFNANVKYLWDESYASSVDQYVDGEMIHNAIQGNLDDFDVVGNAVARDKVDRYEETQWGEVEKSRRWVKPYKAYQALPLDRFDKVRSAISDINSVHTKSIVRSIRHREFIRFFAALVGAALTGETATGTQALPTGQQIAIGSSPSDVITLTKIKSCSAIMDVNGVPVATGRRHWGFGPGQKSAILAITQAASSDFTSHKIYDKGNIDGVEWMGFLWHMFPDVRSQGASGLSTLERILPLSSTTRTNIAWAPDSVGIGRCDNLMTRLDELPQKTYTWQAYGEIDMNAVRVLDGGVVSIACKEE